MKTHAHRLILVIDHYVTKLAFAIRKPDTSRGLAARAVRQAIDRGPRIGQSVSGMVATLSLAAVLTACGSSTSQDPIMVMPEDPNIVMTDKGNVRGTSGTSMRSFKGIPYAAPPVGALRWAPPQPATAWKDTLDASHFSGHCPQSASGDKESEDCLYLNVYSPVDGKDRPVMIWIHGGGLIFGQSDNYDPTQLVAQGVLVVTINYRLGALGWLTHPALKGETPSGSSGNFGLLDQQAAMRWVKANIAAFGGDADNVTLFGQSAGGQSIMAQIASPTAAGLFGKAIVQSGAFESTQPTLEQASARGQLFASRAGCADQSATCLRALPVSKLLEFEPAMQGESILAALSPTVDGIALPRTTKEAIISGNYNKVAVMMGNNSHEFSWLSAVFFDLALGREMNESEEPGFIGQAFGPQAPTVMAQYPLSPKESATWTFDNAVGDFLFACSGHDAAKWLAASGSSVFAYEFNDVNAPVSSVLDFFSPPPRSEGYGAYHSADLLYLFPAAQKIFYGAPFNSAQQSLSSQMIRYWTQFARTGNPNRAGDPNWPAYSAANDTYLSLTPGSVAPDTSFASRHNCAFWGKASVIN
jgi:para-nitrobenzyl esterase